MSFASAISDLFSCGRSRKARESEIGPLDQDAATSEPAAHEAASTPAAPPVEEKTITTTTTTPQVEDHAQRGQEDAGRIAYTALPDIRPTTANWMGDFTEDRDIQLSVVPEKAKPSSGWVVEQRMLVTMPSSSTETETKTSVPEPEPETAQVTPPVRCPTPEQEPWNSTPAARSVTPEPAVESKLEVRSVSPIALRPATAETRIEPELEAQFLAEAFEFTPFWTDETELDLEVKQPAKAAEEISLPASDKTVEPEVIEPKIAEPEVVAPKIVEPTIVEPTIVAPAVVEPIVEPVAEPVAEPKIVEPEIVVPVVPAPKKNTPAPTLLNMPPEVRNKIYEKMTEEGPIRMCRHDDPALVLRDGESARAPKRQFYNFTQVCRAIRNEFLPVYARKTQYIIDLWGQKANLDKVEQLKGQVQMDIDAACFDMEPIDLLPLIRSLIRTGRTDYRFTSTEGVVFRSISEIVGELNKLLPAANGSNKNWIDAVNGPMKKIDLHLFPHDDIRQYYRFRGAEPLVRVVYPSAKSEEWMKQASKSAAYEAYLRKTGLDKFQMHVVVGHASRRTINEGRLPLDWRMSYQLPVSSSDRAPRISMDIAAARMSIDRSALN